jgi:hypothetical protein
LETSLLSRSGRPRTRIALQMRSAMLFVGINNDTTERRGKQI